MFDHFMNTRHYKVNPFCDIWFSGIFKGYRKRLVAWNWFRKMKFFLIFALLRVLSSLLQKCKWDFVNFLSINEDAFTHFILYSDNTLTDNTDAFLFKLSLCEKCLITEFFLVRIFLYSEWMHIHFECRKIRTGKKVRL